MQDLRPRLRTAHFPFSSQLLRWQCLLAIAERGMGSQTRDGLHPTPGRVSRALLDEKRGPILGAAQRTDRRSNMVVGHHELVPAGLREKSRCAWTALVGFSGDRVLCLRYVPALALNSTC